MMPELQKHTWVYSQKKQIKNLLDKYFKHM
jgi:hypothetical protein